MAKMKITIGEKEISIDSEGEAVLEKQTELSEFPTHYIGTVTNVQDGLISVDVGNGTIAECETMGNVVFKIGDRVYLYPGQMQIEKL